MMIHNNSFKSLEEIASFFEGRAEAEKTLLERYTRDTGVMSSRSPTVAGYEARINTWNAAAKVLRDAHLAQQPITTTPAPLQGASE